MPAQTLYVGSLPESASNERLEEIFSEIGPVKQCFVVKDKGVAKCRGFGYVIYAMEEDAQRALKEINDYDGKKLLISVAKKKLKNTKKTATKDAEPPPPPKKETGEKSQNLKKHNLKARLIIRNLSFKCSEDDLKQVFAEFGSVLETKIPLKPDGKMRGFAFVQFKTVCEASIALRAMNLKEIKGRQVAVDWAVPKDKYVAMQATSSARTTATEGSSTIQSESQSDDEDGDEEKNQAASSKVSAKKSPPPMEDSQSDDDDDDDDDDDEEQEEDSEDEDVDDKESQEGEEDNNSDHSLDSAEDADGSDDDDEAEDDKSVQKKTKKPLPSDVQEGRTIFIRNLSFDTEEEGLEEVLLQYGELNYIKIVFHPDTGHSKGCAFAQFKTKEAADRCIAAAQDEAATSGIQLDGRKLLIVAAVSKDDAAKLKVNNKVKVQTGTRNLYLAREGLIRAGTTAAEGVPEADMIKRARFEEVKRTKLRDISVFVSKTRLCVHNLPKSVDDKKLRALCLQAVKEPKGVRIPECRIIYDRKPEKGQVMGQSLGYGFVQFQQHEHALAALRYLNNNPDIFGPHKRPIVEFSLEDSRKLKIKEMRRQKNKEHYKKQTGNVGMTPQPQTSREGKGSKHFGTQVMSSMQQTGKRKAHHDNQRPNTHCGFQTKPEVEHVDLDNGKKRRKVLLFPSHRGPKIRMRDKGKQRAPPPKKARQRGSRKEHQKRLMEKPTQPRTQKSKAPKKHFGSKGGDRFDNLVEQYKKKLLSKSEKTSGMRNSKWFDS
ncbi:RNA-binding protein 28 [Dunckerocampus dactyliophorus]|uniref:RNA-binding protein 28 n=1 Tax=Dunckerocampus dactyliophorus TaxID=161453 RepID=UPI0024060506|nr:RNA-binding protein 28 [Dunckerocampus dactyliophorus]